MSEYAKKQLRKSLDKFGLLEPLIWNEKTGNLVGGHQRLSLMDEDEGWPGCDYVLTVAVVRLTEKQEKAANVFLNNQAAQGRYDKDQLFALLSDGIQIDDIGFTKADLEFEFGELPDLGPAFQKQQNDSAENVAAELDAIKKRKKAAKKDDNAASSNDADYFLMVAFESRELKEAWLRSRGLDPFARYVSAAEVLPDVGELK